MKEKMSLEEATMKALLGELDDSKEDVEGIVDGVLVITDPEITPDEYTEVIDRANEIIEDTPEGEVPFNEEYVGEYIMTCPICGSSFANKEILNTGDACPVCMQVPAEGFVLNGQIATQEDVELQNDIKDLDDENSTEELEVEEPITEEDVEETTEEILASEVTRESDKKLEESEQLNENSEYKSKYDELDELLNTYAGIDNGKLELFNAFNNNEMKEFDDDKYDMWLEDMKNEHFNELMEYLKDKDSETAYYMNKINESVNFVKRPEQLNEEKEIKTESNKYKELKDKHLQEFNEFPIGFAFSDKQFKEQMEKLGLTENDTDKVVPIGASGFIRKSDVDKFNEMNARHREEEKRAIDEDTTGEGYIKDMFDYELANHEYGYTYDLTDTLDSLGLTMNDINNNENLKRGLDLALARYKEGLDESKVLNEALVPVDELPDMCYGVLPSDASIIIIKKGEKGYYKTNKGYENEYKDIEDWNERNDKADGVANRLNAQMDITPEQRMSMELRSMNGNWEDREMKSESVDKEQLNGVNLILNEMKESADNIYDLWTDVSDGIRDILDSQFDEEANISYCIRWLSQALDDLTNDWDNVKTDLTKRLNESKCAKNESEDKEYTLVEADEAKIKELENGSAFTWEGMTSDEDNLKAITEFFKEHTPSVKLPITYYTWSGKLFNEIYGLAGTTAYPDDLSFLAIALDQWSEMGRLPMIKMQVGARWLDDIVDNNARHNELNESCKMKTLDECLMKEEEEIVEVPKDNINSEEEYAYSDIISMMESAMDFDELYNTVMLIRDPAIRENANSILLGFEWDDVDVDVASSVVISEVLNPLVRDNSKNI